MEHINNEVKIRKIRIGTKYFTASKLHASIQKTILTILPINSALQLAIKIKSVPVLVSEGTSHHKANIQKQRLGVINRVRNT